MKLSSKRVLITGADGFIGSHLTEEMVRRGASVRAFVQYNSFGSWGWLDAMHPELKNSIEVVAGDVRDFQCVKDAVEGADLVFNLAALIAIPYSYQAPHSYIETNVGGALNVVQASRDHDVEKVVQVSTSEVYGSAQFVPITEDHPLRGQSPYAASKIGADQIAMSFYYSYKTPVTIARPFNTYGPRQSARAVIPTIITQIANGAGSIKLGALHPTRDFNFVKDTVSGLIACGLTSESTGQTLNIGSDFEISIGDLAGLIAEVMGAKVEILTDEVRLRPEESEVDRLWADNSRAQDLLGWSPEYAGRDGLARGLGETVEWFVNPENLKSYKAEVYNL